MLECNKQILKNEKSLELKDKKKTVYLVTLSVQINRLLRILLAYLNHRLKKIREQFWSFAGDFNTMKEFMSSNEVEFLGEYRTLVANYQEQFPIELNLLTDLEPPKDLYIEIRVLEDCGEVLTTDGDVLKLEKNNTLLVRRQDVEHLIRQNMVVQTK